MIPSNGCWVKCVYSAVNQIILIHFIKEGRDWGTMWENGRTITFKTFKNMKKKPRILKSIC